jgi:16S rRNA (adenine1518-N6/adenine1519-N6)-dimethyltransferase
MSIIPKKTLGQYWLNDQPTLKRIVEVAQINNNDTVLEIGPGLGSLTEQIYPLAKETIAVEIDSHLAGLLSAKFKSSKVEVINQDILSFDLTILPTGYKVVANIPYYLTSHLIRKLCENDKHFSRAVILVQKEIAQRITAQPGEMSILAVTTQFYCNVSKDQMVPASLFTPPPKVDSQILILNFRDEPLFPGVYDKLFFMMIRAGFSQKRKTLQNSLSGGLKLDRSLVRQHLISSGIDPSDRALVLSLDDWHGLYLNISPLLDNT